VAVTLLDTKFETELVTLTREDPAFRDGVLVVLHVALAEQALGFAKSVGLYVTVDGRDDAEARAGLAQHLAEAREAIAAAEALLRG
jgi:hypothetical protein